uniref:Nitroreductase family protein n=1 Tax=Thermofilum pendens TaxID=2269 RepID=A0A7C4BAI4_THEPE
MLGLAERRRSVRAYAASPIKLEDVVYALKAAIQAPSGANQQPWRFVVITDPEVKAEVRRVCEEGEKKFYASVKGELREWLEERGFTWRKSFLTEAPVLVAVFAETGKPYAVQSVWLAIGYMLLALEERELGSLTYTPPNPGEVARVLGAPPGYTLQAVIPVGKSIDPKPKEPRMRLEQAAYLNKWGARFNIEESP